MNLFEWLGIQFNKILRVFEQFIKEVFTDALKIAVVEFKDFAISTVTVLAGTDLTSEAKRLEAFKKIKEEAERRGKKLSDSVINIIIELAVAKIKAQTPTA